MVGEAATVRSLGFRTDLMIIRLRGGTVTRVDGARVVRTPDEPSFRGGNFLLLDEPPSGGALPGWLSRFEAHFPGAGYLRLGIDGTDGGCPASDELAAAGLQVERSTVLAASAVRVPPRPNTTAELRMLRGPADWEAAMSLRLADEVTEAPAEFELYFRRMLAAMRRMQAQAHGGWFGAFIDGRLVCSLGVYSDGAGIGRYQSVATLPEYRNRGLATTLVHTAGEYALRTLGVHTLVIVADPTYHAIRIYRSLGFTDAETQIVLERLTGPAQSG